MREHLTIGHPPVDVTLRRKKNARRLTLRLSADGVFLTVPPRMPLREAEAFLIKQEGWLRKKLAIQPTRHDVMDRGTIPVLGEARDIVPAQGRAARLEGAHLLVPGTPDNRPARIKAFLKELARRELQSASTKYANQLGRNFNKITLRDTRSRWGSCTSTGNLMYSWRLAMAPLPVLDYVAAHEVCHLVHMDHSQAYWQTVASILPGYQKHRDWLKQHGAGLHLIDIGT